MELQEMSTRDLLALHNTLAEAPAGPKSFATKTKMIARIKSIAADRDITLTSFEQPRAVSVVEQYMQPQAENTEATDAFLKPMMASTGKGIGRLARELLLDPAGYPHAAIAETINASIKGAQATAKSVRWYACNMRKAGVNVPSRQKRQTAAI
jgi:hypothetical protein